MNCVEELCREYGSQSEFGRVVGESRQVINSWVKAKKIPINKIPHVSQVTGKPISELLPAEFNEVA